MILLMIRGVGRRFGAPWGDHETVRGWACDVHETLSDSFYDRASGLPGFGLYHSKLWHRVLAQTCGWRVHGLVARDPAGCVSWFLPFVIKRRYPLQRVAVSLPLSHHVMPAAIPVSADEEQSRSAAIAAVVARLPDLEVHSAGPIPGTTAVEWCWRYEIDLTAYANCDALLRACHPRSVREKVARAEREGLRLTRDCRPDHVAAFVDLMAKTRRRLGSAAHPVGFYEALQREFAPHGAFHLHLAWDNDRPVAGDLFLDHGDTMIGYAAASVDDRHLLRAGVNQLVMWAGIAAGFERGLRRVDLGITWGNQDSLREYKLRWATEATRLHYCLSCPPHAIRGNPSPTRLDRLVGRAIQKTPEPLYSRMSPMITKLIA